MNPFIAQIMLFAGNFAPRGWAFCHGQLLSISSNEALFSIIGTIYGGDGRTTFGLPDLRGRAAMHAGNGPGLTTRRLGQRSGTETNTLNALQLPSHNHNVSGAIQLGAPSSQASGNGQFLPVTTGANFYSDTKGNASLNAGALNINIGNTGGNQAVNNMQPYQVLNFIIALEGVYPSRS